MRKLIMVVTIVVIAAFALAACGGDSLEGGSLTIYSGRSEELVGPIIDRFEEESGVDVAVRYAGSTELAATLVEEGDASPADVFFAQDPASLGTVALAGMLQTLSGDITDLVPSNYSDDEGAWVGVSGRSRVVVYDPTKVSSDSLPSTEDGFTAPEWEGRVAVAPTNGSFLAFVAAKILLDGEEATRGWLEGMADNDSPTFEGNSPIVAAVDEGQVDAGLVNHYYLLQRRAENSDVVAENHFFATATAGSLVMPAGAGILTTSENQEAAEEFISFLLSPETQEYFAEETFEYPLIEGVAAPEGLPALDSLASPDVDLSKLATVLDLATDLVAEAGLL
jgi:iron(III) transport system substrate-binding protein